MTREKKINRDNYIRGLIYCFIVHEQAFDWWLNSDSYLFEQVARTANCSVHKVKRIFYKDILINDYNWLMNFTY